MHPLNYPSIMGCLWLRCVVLCCVVFSFVEMDSLLGVQTADISFGNISLTILLLFFSNNFLFRYRYYFRLTIAAWVANEAIPGALPLWHP